MLKTIKKNGLIQPIRQAQGRQAHSGLTIVELLVAVAIIAVLAAGLFTVSNYLNKQSQINLTQSTIDTLVAALEQYHDFYGSFPNGPLDAEQLYYSLSLAPDAKKIVNQINRSLIKDKDNDKYPYLEIVDAWGNDFHYSYTSGNNFPVIDSNGPDGIEGNADDISSR